GRSAPGETHRIDSALLVLQAAERDAVRGCRAVSPPGIKIVVTGSNSTPDDHFITSPHCRMTLSPGGRPGCGGTRPTIRVGIVSPASVQCAGVVSSTPNDHFPVSPHCRVIMPARGPVG